MAKCNGCTDKTSKCNDDCLGCQFQLPTNCVVLEKKLSCSTKPAGTDLSIILEQFCVKFTALEDGLDSITAADIEVEALDCIDVSDVSGTDLQSTLEDLCDVITGIQTDVTDIQNIIDGLAFTASDIEVEALDCIDVSDVSGTDLQSTLEDLCDVLTGIQTDIADLQDGDADWFISGTTNVPTDITDEIYTLGKVGIGLDTPVKVLDVVGNAKIIDDNDVLLVGETIMGLGQDTSLPANLSFLFGHLDVLPDQGALIYGKAGELTITTPSGLSNNIIKLDVSDSVNPEMLLQTAQSGEASQIEMLKNQIDIGVLAAGGGATESLIRVLVDRVSVFGDANEIARFDDNATGGETRFMLYDVTAGTLQRVSIGVFGSGGVGFRLLRVPN